MPITKSTDGELNLQPIISCLNEYQEQEIKLLTTSPRSVKLPNESKATVTMLTATNSDGPAFNTRSQISQQCQTTMDTRPSNTPPIINSTTSDLTTVETTPDITLKPLTADRHEALLQMQMTDPFYKHISNNYQMARHHNMRLIYLHTLKDYHTNTSLMPIRNYWPLSYPKLGNILY